ncbi:phenylalanine--tRNA ligase subunit beta [Rickettsia conorii subsp. heilongjiangensis]|uniref:Phenylalanine--tRNA ligase beta subunit n=1 Tax=Rickettsia conorii subsp. heilongjiangensis TaxID=226665 RepID=A0AAD1GJ25_RICCR|nr:phenylalanine--tRNA ligase subunit beta [Rickettsia conorii]AEK74624.1 phenylalanyl-tRNA synthetase subunit beta [Rickettsia conorii subsp. heilongjiangensis 054]BBM91387.1 phenylalanine--tRNA ligase subunit beta [Rickettsia conorii subsp. heilongjiangensis]BBM92596.1 phenylalanine--tRNA ligase subunit beta [Rickettsia conorii subsp. heilongjiangensis]BBM93805.1 phenylalanine--tRNA ligase subunit beta [Rickettsia conorii subsp. heilongjiangensis]BBM95014.1 phenylalanine--tRNA ligase subunit
MKFTLSWLKQFLETSASVTEIAEALTAIGLEVEEVIDKAAELQKFEVAYITNIKPHPSADKLKLCDVETKSGMLQIVCGARNARAGIKVVLANIGVEIPNGKFKIKESVIRGEKSCGMLCSEEELLLASESEGIIELSEDAVVGENFTKYYGLDDPIFVINVTPNRGDALGVYGIARDLAAKGIGILKELEISAIKSTFISKMKLKVQDKEACPLFTFREIRNLKNKPSPDWLRKLLKNVGVKTISSLVDVTNYISYSFGQPMHAYDADRIKGGITVARHCEKHSDEAISGQQNEIATAALQPRNDVAKCHALNGKEYLLTENDLVIKDESGIQGLAGIIGEADSSCTDSTTNIILEAACFNAKMVAASGRRFQIDTDARYRNERNIDRNFTEKALDIATNLILSICGNGEVSEVVKVGEKESQKKPLDFSACYLEKITGIKLNIKAIEAILNKLGFITDVKGKIIKVIAPSWRHDITILEDIAEEIARIYGYDKIESIKLPELDQDNNKLRVHKRISSFKRILASKGYDEVVTNSFMSSEDAKLFAELKEELFLLNPISIGDNYMRPTILPNLLSIVSKNLARSIKDMAFFEVGPSFIDLNTEATYLTAIISGSYNNKNPHSLGRGYDVFDLKGDLELVADYAGLSIDKCIATNGTALPQYYHPTRAVNIGLGKNLLGHFGQIHPKILKYYDINQEIFAFELNITNLPLIKAKFGKRDEFAVSDFQANFRDYAFIVDQDHRVGEIISYISNFNKKLVKSVILFDIYSGDKLPEGKKSIAVKIELQADDRTLSDTDLTSFSKDLVAAISQKFQGTLRE